MMMVVVVDHRICLLILTLSLSLLSFLDALCAAEVSPAMKMGMGTTESETHEIADRRSQIARPCAIEYYARTTIYYY
jgi:hypothetical protein